MADIDIERKPRSLLPMILGLIAVGVIVFVLLFVRNEEDEADGTGAVVDTMTAATGAPAPGSPPPTGTPAVADTGAAADTSAAADTGVAVP